MENHDERTKALIDYIPPPLFAVVSKRTLKENKEIILPQLTYSKTLTQLDIIDDLVQFPHQIWNIIQKVLRFRKCWLFDFKILIVFFLLMNRIFSWNEFLRIPSPQYCSHSIKGRWLDGLANRLVILVNLQKIHTQSIFKQISYK